MTLHTVEGWLRRAETAGVDRLEAQLLVAHALGRDRSWVLAHLDAEAPSLADALLARRAQGEPLAYILGWREFYGRRFRVDRRVLIPRQETEMLVEIALELDPPEARVLDFGAGSGCVGVTIALERPGWIVTLLDVSRDALDVAQTNARALGAKVLALHTSEPATGPFELIVANPPYVAEGARLPPEVADYEPAIALYAGDDGLAVLRGLAAHGLDILAPGGILATEIGYDQGRTAPELFATAGWHVRDVRADLAGISRVVVVQKP